jgi:hypothetical protein
MAGTVAEAHDTTVLAISCSVTPALLAPPGANARQLPLVVAAIVDPLLVTVIPVDAPTNVMPGPDTVHPLDASDAVSDSVVPPTYTHPPPSSVADPKTAKLLIAATLPVTEITADPPVYEPPLIEIPVVLSCAKPRHAAPAMNVDDCDVTLTVAADVVEK